MIAYRIVFCPIDHQGSGFYIRIKRDPYQSSENDKLIRDCERVKKGLYPLSYQTQIVVSMYEHIYIHVMAARWLHDSIFLCTKVFR